MRAEVGKSLTSRRGSTGVDVELFDRHLAGAELVSELGADQWLVVDCLGLALLDALHPVLSGSLAPWNPAGARFATVEPETTTAHYWSRLAEEGLDHPLLEIDAVDRLLHERRLSLDELERLAVAELRVAVERLAPGLDAGRPLLVFADHGFRLAPEGGRFVHGGPSILERTVPVLRFVPRG